MAANVSSNHTLKLETGAPPVFFVTDTPYFPEGIKRCRRLVETYESNLEATMQSLEMQQRRILEFIDSRTFGGSPRLLDGDLRYLSLQVSVAGARALDAKLQRRLDQTAMHWNTNIQALQLLCRPPHAPIAALASSAEPFEPSYLAPEGNSTLKDTGLKRFVLIQPSERAKPCSDSTNYDNPLQLIAHIARDWSQEGSSSRKSLYGPPLAHLLDLPLNANILVPGSGTGRLAWELATMGYRVLANDGTCVEATISPMTICSLNTNALLLDATTISLYLFLMHGAYYTVSFGMLSATFSILARKLSDGSIKLCPHVHEENSNQVSRYHITY